MTKQQDRNRNRNRNLQRRTKSAAAAALALARAAEHGRVYRDGQAQLSVTLPAQLLLATELLNAPARILAFDGGGDEPIRIERSRLKRARSALRRHLRAGMVEAWVDRHGLHLRWNRRRGGLDLVDQGFDAKATIFDVSLDLAKVA
jgi:hypothetical protein